MDGIQTLGRFFTLEYLTGLIDHLFADGHQLVEFAPGLFVPPSVK
jgi:hypothetical protein